MAKLFLGLDSSTQSLNTVVINPGPHKAACEESIQFDQALPQFKTRHGVFTNLDPRVKNSSPRLWAAALDLLFARLKKGGVAPGKSSPSAAAAGSSGIHLF